MAVATAAAEVDLADAAMTAVHSLFSSSYSAADLEQVQTVTVDAAHRATAAVTQAAAI